LVYARGAMESEHNGYRFKDDPVLQKQFSPRHLVGLGPGLYWEPPQEHARTMSSYWRSCGVLSRGCELAAVTGTLK
jgi:hypothetical protein